MEKDIVRRLENTLVLGIGSLFPLHGYLSISNFVNGIDKGYGHSFPTQSYILIGIYLLIIFTSDIFVMYYRKFELSGALLKYWGSACIAVAIALILYMTGLESDLVMILALFYSPCVVLRPLLEFLGITKGGVFDHVSVAAVGVFCLFNWAACRFAGRERE